MKTQTKVVIAVVVMAFCVLLYLISGWNDWKRISPFTDVVIRDNKMIAEYEGTFYEVAAIDGIPVAELFSVSQKAYEDKWQKRIREDIAEVLLAAGAGKSTVVELELIDQKTGVKTIIPEAEMTKENRSQIYNKS